MTPEEARVLCEFNVWANHRTLEACAALSDEQFTRDLGSGFRSVRDTLVHITSGEWLWLALWRGNPSPRAEMEREFAASAFANLAALRARWEPVEADLLGFVRGLTAADLDRTFEVRRHEFSYPLRALLHHLVNHGTHHRGQVATMLRQLGATPRSLDYHLYLRSLAGRSAD
jgi:uncharacterized damage-inducible protein DinB